MELNDPQLLEQIKLTKQNLNKIYDRQEEIKAKFTKQKYYDNGPRAKKLLAWRIRRQQDERAIHKIKNPQSGKMCQKLKEIQHLKNTIKVCTHDRMGLSILAFLIF